MTAHAAGHDLHACLDAPVVLEPGARALVPTGLAIALPAGHEGQVRPRSGLAFRYGVTVLNSPGTIDADYRGELGVLLINHGETSFEIRHGERIAQLVVSRVLDVVWDERTSLPDPDAAEGRTRGEGGFGSTGRGASSSDPAE